MSITLNTWVILFTCGLIIGAFLVLLFLVFNKRYSIHTHNVTVALSILCLMLFDEIAEETDLVDYYPSLLGLTITADLLLWPFVLFYTQYIAGTRHAYSWKDTLYYIPFFIGLIWQLPYIFLAGEAKLLYYAEGIPRSVAFFVGYKLTFTLVMLWLIAKTLQQGTRRFGKLYHRNKKAVFIQKVSRLFWGLSLGVLMVYLLFFNNYFNGIELGDSDQVSSLMISAFFLLIGVLVFENPKLFQEDNYSKTIKDFFRGRESLFADNLLLFFNQEKPYLSEKLVIKDVAKSMGLSTQQLSYLVNRQLGVSFQDFVNAYRVGEVKLRLQAGEHQQKTLLGIALDSGFSGKASFNRVFKEHTGESPSIYLKKL